jgi:hypothetical protein
VCKVVIDLLQRRWCSFFFCNCDKKLWKSGQQVERMEVGLEYFCQKLLMEI